MARMVAAPVEALDVEMVASVAATREATMGVY